MDFGIATVVGITIICYLIAEIVKASKKVDTSFIPGICGIAGGILGVVGMYTMPDFPATDIINAIAVGIVSGLAATGVNQIFKQANSSTEDK